MKGGVKMNRLTTDNYKYCEHTFCDMFKNGKRNCFGDHCLEYNTYSKLREYEHTDLTPQQIEQLKSENQQLQAKLSYYDKLEQDGRLIELPCKVGKELYLISDRVDGKSHIRRVTLTQNNMGNILSRINRDIYPTKQQAEQALKERENNA